ncbi:MAG: tetratricopeptide repeat protein [Phycisphaerales bacterium]|nr:MAG: tetratricopeptide repeat protein [Phycisphaerales bacterium]
MAKEGKEKTIKKARRFSEDRALLARVIGTVSVVVIVGIGALVWRGFTKEPGLPNIGAGTSRSLKVERMPSIIDYENGVAQSEKVQVGTKFAEGRVKYGKGQYEQAIDLFTACLELEEDHERRGALNLQIGNCYYKLHKYIKAAGHYAAGLRESRKAGDREGEAANLNSMANTYVLRPASSGEARGDNIGCAMRCYKRVLEIYKKDEHPVEYAMTQNNLGGAYTDLPSVSAEELASNTREAIECYKRALETYKKDEYPVEYAGTQNNLGLALGDLPSASPEERASNVREAIECYKRALEIYKKDEYPVKYAATQNHFGVALRALPSASPDERASNVRQAIGCYKRALEIYKKEECPVGYAMAQNNLGNAYTDLPSASAEERASNVRQAIECYKRALEIYKKDEYPQYYCGTAANMGMILAGIDKAQACHWLKEAYSLREFLPQQGREIEELMERVCKEDQ